MGEWEVSSSAIGRDREVVYKEGPRILRIHFELTGLGAPYGWVAGPEVFTAWSEPAGGVIEAEHGQRIRSRVEEWVRANGFTVGFQEGISAEEHFAQLAAKGWTREELPTGGSRFTPPPPSGIIGKVIRWVLR